MRTKVREINEMHSSEGRLWFGKRKTLQINLYGKSYHWEWRGRICTGGRVGVCGFVMVIYGQPIPSDAPKKEREDSEGRLEIDNKNNEIFKIYVNAASISA